MGYISRLCETHYQHDFANCVLLIEEIMTSVVRVDKSSKLYQL